MLLAISVAAGIGGSATKVAPLSLTLLVFATVCAAAALIVHLVETRRPKLGRKRYY